MTTATVNPTDSTNAVIAQDLAEKSIGISVKRCTFGNHRQIASDSNIVQVDAERRLIGAKKTLLDAPELKAIGKIDSRIDRFLHGLSLPSFLRAGVYRISVLAVERVDQKLTAFREERKVAVERLCAVYAERVEEARGLLRVAFDALDYPDVDTLRRSFRLEWTYVTLGSTPGQLEGISEAIFKRQREDMDAKAATALEEYRRLLRVAMADLVAHMVDRLTPGEDGKPKVFRGSLVTNMRDFLGNFPLRDFTNDAELQDLCRRAQDILGGIDADLLRKSTALRDTVRSGFAEMKTLLDGMTVDQPVRAISWDEE
jgi:hypothetical protein